MFSSGNYHAIAVGQKFDPLGASFQSSTQKPRPRGEPRGITLEEVKYDNSSTAYKTLRWPGHIV